MDSYVHISIVWNIWAVIIGALVGTWVSFGARKFEIGFDDLASLEKDKMNPWIRLIYISVAAVIFVLFMDAGLVEIKVGNIDTAAALENMQSAFIIGLVCGLIESKIGVNVYKRAVDIIGEYGSTINGYIIAKRITRAKQLLRFTDMTVDEIGAAVGMREQILCCFLMLEIF